MRSISYPGRKQNVQEQTDDGEIALIPRGKTRFSVRDKAEYARKKAEEAASKDLQDHKYVHNASYAFEEKIRRERRALGLA